MPEGASSLLMPRTMGHQRAFAMLVMGRKFTADDAHAAGFVNVVVAPGHTEAEARKVAREICALPAEAVAISRKLLKLPPEDMTRRIDQEGHLFGERMRSKEAIARVQGVLRTQEGVARTLSTVIASAAKQSIAPHEERMDCFVATLLAMTNNVQAIGLLAP